MFSKFFAGQSESTLAALEMQWRMEYAKATRKFAKQKEDDKKGGRPKLGQLQLNVLNTGKSMDFSAIARNVATTRKGRRIHKCAVKTIERNKKQSASKKQVYLACCVFVLCTLLAF